MFNNKCICEQKLLRHIVHEAMFKFGPITIVAPFGTNSDISIFSKVITPYTISPLDGRINVNGWKEFMEKEDYLQIGSMMQFVLFTRHSGVFLFAFYIHHIPLE